MSDDPFALFPKTPMTSGLTSAMAITPSDTVDLPVIPLGFFCINGDMRLTMMDGQTIDLKAGSMAGYQIGLSLRVKRIHATGTTATNFVIMW